MHINWWTLALQTVNVLVLIWILSRLFFRPVADIVAKRQEQANKLLADAAAARRTAEEIRAGLEKAQTDVDENRGRLIDDARKSAQLEKVKLLAQTNLEITKLRHDAEATIVQDRLAAQEEVVARAGELSVQIAARLLARLPPQTGLSAFLDGLRQELESLPPDVKHSLAAKDDENVAAEVVTAAKLSDAESAQVRTVLEQALGAGVRVEFRSDPSVIGGIELHGRAAIVRNSWRADLRRIREDLIRDEHTRET